MSALFWIAAAVILQAYVGYPISLALLRLALGERSRHASGSAHPTITLVISAYNEEKVIGKKLENSLALDYPSDRLDIVVVSDGSTDRTEDIVRAFEERGVSLQAFRGRQGKVACLNQVLPSLQTDLLVMSDANSIYETGSLLALARHFEDPRVGCVCGRLRYVNPQRLPSGEGEILYWRYEGWIKRLESALGSLLGANGAMYAFRRPLFRPVDPLMFCDDVIPVRIALQGYLTLYDPEASCTEETAEEAVERRRRTRHASFGMRSMVHLAGEALRNGRWLILYQCVSHRIVRWLSGVALAVLVASSAFLPDPWRWHALAGEGALFGAAGLGYLTSRTGSRFALFYLPYYFLVISVSGLVGLAAYVRRSDRPYWEPRR